ncbi:MAG TPA: hypothetical protein VFN44_02895 [Solirubrobacteraceae bacterium]|nr:hypothetical protein [Solirubrobacteraceae bacterium]
MITVRRLAPAAATAALVALVLHLVYGPWFLNYDARYALLWAQDLANGHAPEYKADFAPTPHPLQTAFGLLALPFGDGADDVMVIATLLAFGALVYLAFALGRELYSPWVGLVAALVVLTRPVMERDALLAYQDVPFAALVVGAVLAEARGPKRGATVLALLAVAGLLRPEAWVLSGLYVLWIWRENDSRGRATAVAIAAAAPLIWALSDWAVTGDPLHSLHGTADLAIANDRRRSITDVPYWTAQYFGYALREPLVLGVPVGLVFAWFHARRQSVLPLAVVVAMVAVFAVGPIFGLPLIRRYIATPAVLLTLFYGLAVVGWTMLPHGRARRRWLVVGVVSALLSVAYLPWHYDLLSTVERRIDRDGVLYGDLQEAMDAPQVRAAFAACPELTAGDHRPMPYARYWLDGAPGTVSTVEGGASPMGKLLLMPVKGPTTSRIYPPKVFPKVKTPEGFTTIYANRSWRVSAAPECR